MDNGIIDCIYAYKRIIGKEEILSEDENKRYGRITYQDIRNAFLKSRHIMISVIFLIDTKSDSVNVLTSENKELKNVDLYDLFKESHMKEQIRSLRGGFE